MTSSSVQSDQPSGQAAPAEMASAARRVMERCDCLAGCSEETGRLTRLYLGEAMHAAHRELSGWMKEAGLTTRVDAAGNLIGRFGPTDAKRVLLVGSHLDTVPNAGKYDGVLGVLIGLAAIEQLNKRSLPFAIDLIGFSEEEGVRFVAPYIGSRAVAGKFDKNWLARTDEMGITLADAIARFGLNPDQIEQAAYSVEQVIGYIEAHLEQGPVLERAGHPVGIVTGIAGQSRLRVRFTGEAGHAGTTPMEGRRDAAVGAAALILETQAVAKRTPGLRATVGCLQVTPNSSNVIPACAELSLDVRHPDDKVRKKAIEELLAFATTKAAEEGLSFETTDRIDQPAVAVDQGLSESLAQAAKEAGCEAPKLPSGAGHDAVAIAESFPVSMLFIRHPGGISHHPDERVDEPDVAVAIDVLTRFFQRLAEGSSEA